MTGKNLGHASLAAGIAGWLVLFSFVIIWVWAPRGAITQYFLAILCLVTVCWVAAVVSDIKARKRSAESAGGPGPAPYYGIMLGTVGLIFAVLQVVVAVLFVRG